jgi:hypothetical protein
VGGGFHADPFMLHIYAALAEKERRLISARTRAALQAAKARGKRTGRSGAVGSGLQSPGCRASHKPRPGAGGATDVGAIGARDGSGAEPAWDRDCGGRTVARSNRDPSNEAGGHLSGVALKT